MAWISLELSYDQIGGTRFHAGYAKQSETIGTSQNNALSVGNWI